MLSQWVMKEIYGQGLKIFSNDIRPFQATTHPGTCIGIWEPKTKI